MNTVYVVMASEGEWSERREWVCGVFGDADEAKRIVRERAAKARADEAARAAWEAACVAACGETPGGGHHVRNAVEIYEAARDATTAALGRCPVPEADEFWAVAVPVGEWGRWDTWLAQETTP